MKLLPKEWDLIIRALKTLANKIDAGRQQGFQGNEFEQIKEIETLIERIDLNRTGL